jgi:site-specific DNA-methyltransferase (adenine-specific)
MPGQYNSNNPKVVTENHHAQSVRHNALGRFPANLIHDGSEEVVNAFPYTESHSGAMRKGTGTGGKGINVLNAPPAKAEDFEPYADKGSASRFFYSAKASKKDRMDSKHPTVKPISLMRYLCRLITPPNGIVLDPFAGSGTTGQAAILEGFNVIMIEKDPEYYQDILNRMSYIEKAKANEQLEIGA